MSASKSEAQQAWMNAQVDEVLAEITRRTNAHAPEGTAEHSGTAALMLARVFGKGLARLGITRPDAFTRQIFDVADANRRNEADRLARETRQ